MNRKLNLKEITAPHLRFIHEDRLLNLNTSQDHPSKVVLTCIPLSNAEQIFGICLTKSRSFSIIKTEQMVY